MTPLAFAVLLALPAPLDGVGVTEHLGAALPLDLELRDQDDRPVRLRSYVGDGKPVVLVLAYYQCPMLCGLVLRGVAEGLRGVGWELGREYRAITVSIDPRDGWQEAGRAQATALAAAGAQERREAWPFLTGDAPETRRLAAALGFGYRWDEASRQFAHPAVVFVLTPDGRVSRYLYGIDPAPRQLRLALVEAADGKTGSFADRVLLYCFHWDPASRRYGVFVARFLRIGAVVVVAVLATLVVTLVRLERRRRRA